jgi:hypothetical protein
MNQPPFGHPPGGPGQPGGPPPGGYPPQGQFGYGQPQAAAPAQFHPPPQPTRPDAPKVGFFGSLFDFSFKSLVTPRVIKVLYGLFLLLWVLYILGGIGYAGYMMIDGQALIGIATLILLPIAALLYLVFGRMWHELIVILFHISEDLHEINRKTRG